LGKKKMRNLRSSKVRICKEGGGGEVCEKNKEKKTELGRKQKEGTQGEQIETKRQKKIGPRFDVGRG